VKVDKDPYWGVGVISPAWSPDSRWLAYSRRWKNYLGAVFVYFLTDNKPTQITDGMSDAQSPVFDKDGKYLYFTASTDVGASLQPDIHSFSHPTSRSIYLAVLDKALPSPFAPESDEERPGDEKKKSGEEKKSESPARDGGEAESAAKEVTVKIDLDNILQRILSVPMPARRYTELQAGKAGLLFAVESPAFGPGVRPDQGRTVHRFDMKTRKADVPVSGVGFFEIAANGEKMLYRQGDRWFIKSLPPMASGGGKGPAPGGQSGETPLKTDSLEVRIDPPLEWKQMYREAWRLERDFFYDPNFHGLDLQAAEKKYEPYLAGIA
jgi:tricorn protease